MEVADHVSNSLVSGIFFIGGCFTNVSRVLQNILSKCVYCRNSTCDENFKLKLCTCTKFQLEILTINVISGVVYFHEIILESSRNVSETPPWASRIFRKRLITRKYTRGL